MIEKDSGNSGDIPQRARDRLPAGLDYDSLSASEKRFLDMIDETDNSLNRIKRTVKGIAENLEARRQEKTEREQVKTNLTDAIKDKLKGPGVRGASYESFVGEESLAFVNVKTEELGLYAHISAEHDPDPEWGGDSVKVRWLDKTGRKTGIVDLDANTGDVTSSNIIRVDDTVDIFGKQAVDESWKEYLDKWNNSAGREDVFGLIIAEEMTTKEIGALTEKLKSAQPDPEMTEKAMEYLKEVNDAEEIDLPSPFSPTSTETKEIE